MSALALPFDNFSLCRATSKGEGFVAPACARALSDRGEDSFDKVSAAARPWWSAKAWEGAGLMGKTRDF